MKCLICGFEFPADDARIAFHRPAAGAPAGACICIGCSARVLREPQPHMSTGLEREIEAILQQT